MGPAGSSGKKGCSLVVSGATAAAAADAYCLLSAIGGSLVALRMVEVEHDGRIRLAVRRKEAIVRACYRGSYDDVQG
jgi:hypothetical protein